ncbi:AAC_HP2_G0007410.mRNA.1.CDS.1 [Saccharomyces cerevisiae]|nr:YDL124W-like protein [Saccharomyces cerevisiae FostersB]KAF4006853.1 NADPH-dependent alpha-keto amide reductase [Saccharomyces cerevisiae]CAI5005346.1 ATV_HP_G0145230.mRNA.1.CDS.1 [Saccharomyces cerevisiae]CAI5037891.1 ATV_HP_G0018930.mRNA.1.CDS.1 [Saccharomyces cerevisiae]CAI5128593.1 ATV_HP_G0047840.mRNA.1.CDS.1 [Saccharomyces cerevisiae]
MSFHQQFFTLNNGNKIPAIAIIGTGTRWYKNEETDATFSNSLVEQIVYALKLPGIIHIDAAEIYRTYPEVGKALSLTEKPRNAIFLTDKYSPQIKMSDSPAEGLDLALKKMGTDYVDLYLLHSPFVSKEVNGLSLEEAWKDMEQLYKSGKAKNIGVSNFAVEDLQRILKVAEVKPQVNQIEFSPFLQNQTPGIYKFCQEHDILLEAYSPLGPLQKKTAQDDSQPFFEYVKELSEKYIKSEAQIILRWVTKRGVLPVTTSSKPQRISDAQNLFSFDLTAEEVDKITELGLEHEPLRLYWNKLYGKYNYAAQKV